MIRFTQFQDQLSRKCTVKQICNRVGKLLLSLSLLFGLAACSLMPQTKSPSNSAGAIISPSKIRTVPITAQFLAEMDKPKSSNAISSSHLPSPVANWSYRLGAGDVLSIIVYDHPQLTIPAGPQRSAVEAGNIVRADGTIYYPFVGSVEVAGKTVSEVRSAITKGLKSVIPNPQIDVRVAQFNSQQIHLSGAVHKPGSIRVTNIPMTVANVIAAGGGPVAEIADLNRVVLIRDGETFDVNLNAYLNEGATENNPLVYSSDQIIVSTRQNHEVYMLGELVKPNTLPLGDQPVSLTDAIARSGGLSLTSANATGVFVFRQAADINVIDVFQLNTKNPLAYLLGVNFMLEKQDIVYVTSAPAARWNRLILNLVPSLSFLNSLLLIENATTR